MADSGLITYHERILSFANQEAQRFNHEYIGTEHLLLALVKERDNLGSLILRQQGIDLTKVREETEKLVESGEDMFLENLPQTPLCHEVWRNARDYARELNSNYIGSGHVLYALMNSEGSVAAQVLKNLHLDEGRIKKGIEYFI